MLYKMCARCGAKITYPAILCGGCKKSRGDSAKERKATAAKAYGGKRDKGREAFYRTKGWKLARAKRLQMAGYMCESCGKAVAEV